MKSKIKCEVIGYEDIEFEVGQKWKTRSGKVVEINALFDDSSLTYPIEAGAISYTRRGIEFKNRESENDLVELVAESGVEQVDEAEVESVEGLSEEPVEDLLKETTEMYKDNADLWEYSECAKLKVVDDNHKLEYIGIQETSVEDKMVEILHQLLRQRDRDLEKISLVFNTFIKLEKMK